MRERFKQKPIVAVLLPILFLLVGLISIYQWNPLKADDQNAHLVDVKVNGKEIDENYSVTEQGTLLEMSTEKPQVLKFLESEKYKVELRNEKGEPLPTEKVSNEQLAHFQDLVKSQQESSESTEQTNPSTDSSSDLSAEPSTSQEVEEIASQIFYVIEDEKKVPYLLLDKEETIWLSVSNKNPEEATTVVLEDPTKEKKQPLISFKPKKTETIETSKVEKAPASSESKASSEVSGKQDTAKSTQEEKTDTASSKEKETTSSSVKKEETSSSKETAKKSATKTKATKLTKEEKKRNLAIEQLLDEKYEEKDSFKPIELPAETASSRETKSGSSPISVTGAKMVIKDGTEGFDPGNNNPGYDSGANNELVRSFDSIIYLLTFSLEANDPTTTYSDIKYSVEMELPNAYALDTSGKQRFNGEVVSDNSELDGTNTDTTRASIGSVESTISANGQILLPMFVNVYGAQHGTNIQPTMKIKIISAKNDKTREVESIDLTYDQSKLTALDLRETKVSAKPSVKANIEQGGRTNATNFISSHYSSWEAIGVGITLGLKPIDSRGTADFRGATFPVGDIDLKLNSKTFYQTNVGAVKTEVPTALSGSTTSTTRPVQAMASSVATDQLNGWDQVKYSGTMNLTDSLIYMGVPRGKTEEIHTQEPQVSTELKKQIGVYDTGNVNVTNSGMNINVKNSDYTPIYNPYTYNYTGTKTSDNEKLFSSSMMVVEWCKDYIEARPDGVYTTDLKIAEVSYEGETYTNPDTLEKKYYYTTFSEIKVSGGIYYSAAVFVDKDMKPLSSSGGWGASSGDGNVGIGQSDIYAGGHLQITLRSSNRVVQLVRWNANSFEFDSSRELYVQEGAIPFWEQSKTRYGVGKTQDHPTLKGDTQANIENQYIWYETAADAMANGKISAVKFEYRKDGTYGVWNGVPVKVIGPVGDVDQFGNPNVCTLDGYGYINDSLENQQPLPATGPNDVYKPSKFDQDGNKLNDGGHNTLHRDTLFIKSFGITTTTTPKKPVYKTTEEVDWTVKGNILSEVNTEYGVRLTTTLPKGLDYQPGSSIDGSGTSHEPVSFVKDPVTGQTTLIWECSGLNPTSGDSPEINFKTTPTLKDITFDDASISEATVKTVGDIWLQSDPSKKDTSKESVRASSGKVQLYQMQQIVLTKEVDKSLIEVGKKDPALSNSEQESLTDITYKITLTNNSSDKLINVNVVDVMPYDNDRLNSSFNGSYTVKGIKVVEGSGDITYTRDPVQQEWEDDPSKIYGWGLYVPGTSNVESIRNAKGFLVSTKELAVGDSLSFEVTISPTGQKAGDIYRNRATFNSHLDLPVKSNIVQTQVLGRDLTGYVWYDDDYDGKIGLKDDGTPEDPVGNIPVKLYRTSQNDSSYDKELVKESLTGQQFIDGAGDSLIKTGADGKYKFENLPEGNYIAEFMVGDIVVTQKIAIVTLEWQGTNTSLNSKADPNPNSSTAFKTPSDFKDKNTGSLYFNHPELSNLPALLTGTDKVSHITDVNAGLTRLSKIRLFKYEEGSVIDVDKDGTLSDAEIEASTTNALEGAEFQLYKGEKDDPDTIKDENKIGSPVATGSDGWLEFGSLPPGYYTIVETKAPDGYELLKNPIEVYVPTYNYIAIVHVPDSAQTKLPFTGSTKAARIILIVSACLLVVGMTGVFLHFRPIKVRGGK